MLITTVSCGFGIKDDTPKKEISSNIISSAVLAQIKADIIEKNLLSSEIDPQIDYSVSDQFPIDYDKKKITDLIFIKHNDPQNADMVAVIKFYNSERYAKNIAKNLLDYQKANTAYKQEERTKLENTLILKTGNYIIYITYENPKRIKDAIFETIQ